MIVSQNVLADAQFTVAAVLRPFEGFEAVYQGQSVFTPIVFPGTLDEDAGKPGFSPYLLRGLSVPMGAKVQLWFPAVVGTIDNQPLGDYKYLLIWRLRNVADFAARQRPFHLKKDSFGASDTFLAPTPPDRYVLPAATETVVYQQAEPATFPPAFISPGAGLGVLRSETIAVPSDLTETFASAGLPLLPPNAAPPFANGFPVPPGTNLVPLGAYQQGVIDPRYSNTAPTALFRPYFTVAKGDELIIACARNNPNESILTWDFSGPDFQFSNLYGTNAFPPSGTTSHRPFSDLGIYVFTGSNPS